MRFTDEVKDPTPMTRNFNQVFTANRLPACGIKNAVDQEEVWEVAKVEGLLAFLQSNICALTASLGKPAIEKFAQMGTSNRLKKDSEKLQNACRFSEKSSR